MAGIDEILKDDEGYIICKPIKELMATVLAETSVLLAVRYLDSPEQLQKGEFNQIQFALTPEQCRDLAELLQKAAAAIPQRNEPKSFDV